MSVARAMDDYARARGYGRPNQTQSERDANLAAWGCVAMLVLWPLSLILRGYVLQQLWVWFLVPLGVMAISLPHALGLSGLLYLFTLYSVGQQPKDGEELSTLFSKALWLMFGMPVMALLFGWVWHAWM